MNNRKNTMRLLALSLAICMLMGSLIGCKKQERATAETEDTTFGIDVARYQGTIDWQEVAGTGLDFAIVRVGYRGMSDGIIKEDSNGRYNLQEASKAGLALGAYFFSTAVTEEEAREEAAWVADILDGYPITYPVAYDCENHQDVESRQYGMTAHERTDAAMAFLEEIEKRGYEGIFYASKNDIERNHYWEIDRIQEEYKIWVAQYPAEPYPQTPYTSYSGDHHMWQHSMEGQVAGVRGPVDLNIAYFGYDGIEPAKNKETPEEVGPDIEAMMDFDDVDEQVTAKDETNLRDIPSQDTDSQVLRVLKNGEFAQRIAVSNSGWSKLLLDGQIYYAVSSYLTTDSKYGYETQIIDPAEATAEEIKTKFSETNQQVTAKDVVNLRSLPSVEHTDVEVIAQLKNGDVATCVGVSDNGWSKLIYRGTTCYAISSYLTTVQQAASAASAGETVDMDFAERNEVVTAVDKVNLRTIPNTESKDSKVITQLLQGDTAIRVGVSDNGWSKLIYNGTTCYAVSRYLTLVEVGSGSDEIQTQFEAVSDQVTAKVEVNLRSIPSVEDPACVVVATLTNGEVVERTGINRDLGWSRVNYKGQTLYCVTSYLKAAE